MLSVEWSEKSRRLLYRPDVEKLQDVERRVPGGNVEEVAY